AKLLGVAFGASSESSMRSMMGSGIHNDYLRIIFSTGLLGFIAYLGIYASLALRLFNLENAERFLLLGGMGVVLMYSISILPTLYAPLMYLCLSVYAYAALPRAAAQSAAAPQVEGIEEP